MSRGGCFYQSSCINFPLIDFDDNKLTGFLPGALIKSSGFSAPSSRVFSYSSFSGPTFALSLELASVSNNQVDRYTKKNLQKATKPTLDSFFQGRG